MSREVVGTTAPESAAVRALAFVPDAAPSGDDGAGGVDAAPEPDGLVTRAVSTRLTSGWRHVHTLGSR